MAFLSRNGIFVLLCGRNGSLLLEYRVLKLHLGGFVLVQRVLAKLQPGLLHFNSLQVGLDSGNSFRRGRLLLRLGKLAFELCNVMSVSNLLLVRVVLHRIDLNVFGLHR
jgi:hypothetical protein